MKTIYQIDPVHSTAQFSIRHLMITNVRGAFSNVTGTVIFDPDNLAESSLEADIDANTISTRDENRDGHLRSADFLDVAAHPKIVFKSNKIDKAGDGELTIAGNLTIHGVTKPVVLTVEGPTDESKDPWGNLRVGASGSTKIKRSDFGLIWNAPLETGGVVLGDDLKIDLEISMVKAQAAAA